MSEHLSKMDHSYSVISGRTSPNNKTTEGWEEFDHIIGKFLKEQKVPGASLAISRNGIILYQQGYGVAGGGRRVQQNSMLRIASISKPVTAALSIHVCDELKLSLDTKVFGKAGILKSYRTRDKRMKNISVRHLLQHSAGWDRDKVGDAVFVRPQCVMKEHPDSPAFNSALLAYALRRKLQFSPGTWHSYSNLGYLVLGEIIETLSGQPFHQAMRAFLLQLDINDVVVGKRVRAPWKSREVEYFNNREPQVVDSLFPGEGEVLPQYGGMAMESSGSYGGLVSDTVSLLKFIHCMEQALDVSSGEEGGGHSDSIVRGRISKKTDKVHQGPEVGQRNDCVYHVMVKTDEESGESCNMTCERVNSDVNSICSTTRECVHGSVHGSGTQECVHGSVHSRTQECVHDSVHSRTQECVHDSVHGSRTQECVHDSVHSSITQECVHDSVHSSITQECVHSSVHSSRTQECVHSSDPICCSTQECVHSSDPICCSTQECVHSSDPICCSTQEYVHSSNPMCCRTQECHAPSRSANPLLRTTQARESLSRPDYESGSDWYGLGWDVQDNGNSWGHTGGMEGSCGTLFHHHSGLNWAFLLNSWAVDSDLNGLIKYALCSVPHLKMYKQDALTFDLNLGVRIATSDRSQIIYLYVSESAILKIISEMKADGFLMTWVSCMRCDISCEDHKDRRNQHEQHNFTESKHIEQKYVALFQKSQVKEYVVEFNKTVAELKSVIKKYENENYVIHFMDSFVDSCFQLKFTAIFRYDTTVKFGDIVVFLAMNAEKYVKCMKSYVESHNIIVQSVTEVSKELYVSAISRITRTNPPQRDITEQSVPTCQVVARKAKDDLPNTSTEPADICPDTILQNNTKLKMQHYVTNRKAGNYTETGFLRLMKDENRKRNLKNAFFESVDDNYDQGLTLIIDDSYVISKKRRKLNIRASSSSNSIYWVQISPESFLTELNRQVKRDSSLVYAKFYTSNMKPYVSGCWLPQRAGNCYQRTAMSKYGLVPELVEAASKNIHLHCLSEYEEEDGVRYFAAIWHAS